MSNEFIFETGGFGNESQFENSSEFFEGEFEDEFEDEYLGEDEDEIRRGASFRRPAYRPATRAFNRPRSFARRPLAGRRALVGRRALAGRRAFGARRPLMRPGWRRPGTRFRSPYGLRRLHPSPGRRFPLRRYPLYPRRFPSSYPQPYPYPAPYPAPLPYSEPSPPASTAPSSSGAGAPQANSGAAVPPPQEASEQVRLTQSLLNRVLSLNLPVNGVMDAATRSAIRSFQSQNPDATPPAEPAPAEGGAGEPPSQPPGDEQDAPQGEFPYYDDDNAMNFRQRRRLRRGR